MWLAAAGRHSRQVTEPAITETVAATPPTQPGQPWLTITAGDGTGPHDVADLVLNGTGGRQNRLICRCGERLGAAPYTIGYRLGSSDASGRADMLRQHTRRKAGACEYCGKSSCWCAMTIGT